MGEAAVAWIAAMGFTAGDAYSGGIASAIGLGLKWGTEQLMHMIWQPQDEHYKPGDLVVVTNDTLSSVKEELRRRRLPENRPEEYMDAGIVTETSADGHVAVFTDGRPSR